MKYNVIILIVLVILSLMLLLRVQDRQDEIMQFTESDIKRLRISELVDISAKEFIDILVNYKAVYISNDKKINVLSDDYIGKPYIQGWPSKSDIPYLLSIANKKAPCGIIWNIMGPDTLRAKNSKSTVGEASLMLIKAVKENKFFFLESMKDYSWEEAEILGWAKQNIDE